MKPHWQDEHTTSREKKWNEMYILNWTALYKWLYLNRDCGYYLDRVSGANRNNTQQTNMQTVRGKAKRKCMRE